MFDILNFLKFYVFFIFSQIYLEKTLFIDLLRKERKRK